MIAQSRRSFVGSGGSEGDAGWGSACAGAHGLRDDLELVGSRAVVLLLVLDTAVVFEEELAGLLEHSSALTDWAVGHTT